MQLIDVDDGTEIAYRSFGNGSKVVMLIHGWSMSGAVYNDLIEHLDHAGLRVIVPDLRGAGASEKPDSGYSIERYAHDVLAIADSENIHRFVVVGHSMGGQIAQWIAAHHPDRVEGVVLLCPVPASGMALPEEAIGLFASSGGNREATKTILGMATKELSESAMERLLDDAMRTSADAVRLSFDSWRKGGFADALGGIRAPLLCVGTSDPFLPPEFLRAEVIARVPGSRLAFHPGPGHYPQVERPRETAALVEAFLAALRT